MARSWSALRYPLNIVLGGSARVAVLRELAQHGGLLSAPQTVNRTGLSQSSIREALITLVGANVVIPHGAGKQILYQLDRSHPLGIALYELFATEATRYSNFLEELSNVGRRHDDAIVAIWIFGSAARQADGFESDLDLAVVTSGQLAIDIREEIEAVGNAAGLEISITAITSENVINMERAENPLLVNIAADAKAVYGPRPLDLLRSKRAKTDHG